MIFSIANASEPTVGSKEWGEEEVVASVFYKAKDNSTRMNYFFSSSAESCKNRSLDKLLNQTKPTASEIIAWYCANRKFLVDMTNSYPVVAIPSEKQGSILLEATYKDCKNIEKFLQQTGYSDAQCMMP